MTTPLHADGVNGWEFTGTWPVGHKVAWVTRASYSGNPMDAFTCVPLVTLTHKRYNSGRVRYKHYDEEIGLGAEVLIIL